MLTGSPKAREVRTSEVHGHGAEAQEAQDEDQDRAVAHQAEDNSSPEIDH